MAYWNLFENHSVNANWKDVFFLGNLCVDGAIWDIYGFQNHIYEIWKLALMWKVIYFLCTLSRVHILGRDCPPGLQVNNIFESMSSRAETEPLENSKIKIWHSHKNTVADDSFFPLSHLIPISLMFLHSITEAKLRTMYSFQKFLSLQFKSP